MVRRATPVDLHQRYDEFGDPKSSKSNFYLLWGGLSSACLMLAVGAYIFADFGANAQSQPRVDRRTTASTQPLLPKVNVVERRERALESNRQKQRIEDLTRVISRLRNEQTALNDRLAELDTTITQTQEFMRGVERTLVETRALAATQTVAKTKVTEAKNISNVSPEPSSNIKPKSVVTKKFERQKNASVEADKIKKAKQQEKPNKAEEPEVDTITTAAIDPADASTPQSARQSNASISSTNADGVEPPKRVQTSRFAIDLGVNPTKGRAEDLWKTLLDEKQHILAKLEPRYVKTGNEEEETRLIAGPFTDASDAIRACVSLRAIKSFCKTTIFRE